MKCITTLLLSICLMTVSFAGAAAYQEPSGMYMTPAVYTVSEVDTPPSVYINSDVITHNIFRVTGIGYIEPIASIVYNLVSYNRKPVNNGVLPLRGYIKVLVRNNSEVFNT